MPLIPLTQPQRNAANVWLRGVGDRTLDRGREIFREGRVMTLMSMDDAVGYRATVMGGSVYETSIVFTDGTWLSDCSCPVEFDCKHGVALMLSALAVTAEGTEAGAGVETASAESLDPTSCEAELEKRLERKLQSAERRMAKQVDDIFKSFRHRLTGVPKSVLESIAGPNRSFAREWGSVQLWGDPPKTGWEACLYIAAYLRREKIRVPQEIGQVLDWTEVDAVTEEFERWQNANRWRQWLEKAETTANEQEDSNIPLRARLNYEGLHLEWRKISSGDFKSMPAGSFVQFVAQANGGRLPFEERSFPLWQIFNTGFGATPFLGYTSADGIRVLNRILRDPALADLVVGPSGEVLQRPSEPLVWRFAVEEGKRTDYRFELVRQDGATLSRPLVTLDGKPSLYVTATEILQGPSFAGLDVSSGLITIPAEAMETSPGMTLIDRMGVEPPERLARRVKNLRMKAVFECSVATNEMDEGEHLIVEIFAETHEGRREEFYGKDGWVVDGRRPDPADVIVRRDRRALGTVPDLLNGLKLTWWGHGQHWHKPVAKKFADHFSNWLQSVPSGVEVLLDPELASFREPTIAARVRLEVEESGIDWFDVRIALDVPDTTLTKAELKALLDARGGYVRLGSKGWRRLSFQLSEEDQSQLAELGLNAGDLSGEKQKLHALQLAGKQGAKRLLSEEHSQAIERRAEEIRTRVTPPLPPGVHAELRPYQVQGFHFLAYLSTNRFGGILADDMGLGKTLQTLTWLMWVRQEESTAQKTSVSLVVCPKSVMDNWQSEARHFVPDLRVTILKRGADAKALDVARKDADIVVANYAQLRLLEAELTAVPWQVVILDEAQAIKNPESQTARAAWKLKSAHRLALSGTPIENRLLDLWSIMQFAMPGVLGPKASFAKNFDQKTDPLARKRLSARVRPFVLRRTKSEVAKDLPERIEEDLLCELDGPQGTLYRAELKRARAALLKLTTQAELDKARFNMLTSLLRLRQICCHPALISEKANNTESAKLTALVELLEPLVAEGHKVLVFSQFVQMLSLIQDELVAREWKHFILTGETEDRGALVSEFQQTEGSAVFLISLRAGGFGLNLTAASYVVLFDPWWNPAVENQAIDRTHRIGQKNTVIAYRLLVKETIEEKIRALQTQKKALAADILGEESFAQALTLQDFQFLLGD